VIITKKECFGIHGLHSFYGNILTTWWIWNSTISGALMAFILNSLFTAIVFQLYHISRKKLFDNKKGAFILLFYWVTWEYIHMNWDLTWSWLNLGNVFATKHTWIQWYEYTGSLGGTAWVIIVNIIIYNIITSIIHKVNNIKLAISVSILVIVILVPLIFSVSIYNNYHEEENPVDIVVVQPNIDPYNEQYSMPYEKILDKNLELASRLITDTTDFLIFPESALQEDIWEEWLDKSVSLRSIKKAFDNIFQNINCYWRNNL